MQLFHEDAQGLAGRIDFRLRFLHLAPLDIGADRSSGEDVEQAPVSCGAEELLGSVQVRQRYVGGFDSLVVFALDVVHGCLSVGELALRWRGVQTGFGMADIQSGSAIVYSTVPYTPPQP